MTIAAISPELAASSVQSLLSSSSAAAGGNVFDKLLSQLDGVNTQLQSAEQSVQQLANGGTENLHQVILNLEQARLNFDLILQVRNKVLDAYQEVMRVQV